MTYRLGSLAMIGLLCIGACTINSTPNKSRGQAGESCQARDDCADGLACVAGVCSSSGTQSEALDGSVGVAPQSQEGESCGSRADCAPGLVCKNQICISAASKADSDASTPQTVAVGQRGESCRTAGDCAPGLACVDNTCTLGQLNIKPTGNECVAIQCRTPADCCTMSSSCKIAQQGCAAGDQEDCDFFDLTCKCTAEAAEGYECVDYACKAKTTCTPSDAGVLTFDMCRATQEVCNPATSKCVQCLNTVDCSRRTGCTAGNCTCADNKCVPTCTKDIDCTGMQECQNGQCVKVGCKTHRECIAQSGNVLSTCDVATGECKLPCNTDAECNGGSISDGTGSRFRVCVNNACQDIGCETKTECRLLLHPSPSSGYIDVDCVPKTKKP